MNIGDKVVERNYCFPTLEGMVGTIIVIRDDAYGVIYDEKFFLGNDLDGACSFGEGIWYKEKAIRLATEEEIELYELRQSLKSVVKYISKEKLQSILTLLEVEKDR